VEDGGGAWISRSALSGPETESTGDGALTPVEREERQRRRVVRYVEGARQVPCIRALEGAVGEHALELPRQGALGKHPLHPIEQVARQGDTLPGKGRA
jgi:hypothetical protein